MRINHNIAALNTYRQLTANGVNGQKSLEKLSSGLRINKAGDDAAGLAISEKMRGQIRGLDQASRNAQDGISLLQTAEGALSETHSILQRMRELATQSATDTNTSVDRSGIQQEMDELAKEISRISNTSQFNTKNLLAGGLNVTFQIGANSDQKLDFALGAMDAKSLGVAGNATVTTVSSGELTKTGITSVSTDSEGVNGTYVMAKKTDAAIGTITQNTINGTIANDSSAYNGSSDKVFQVKIAAATGGAVDALNYSTDGGTTWTAATKTSANHFTLGEGVKITLADDAGNLVGDSATIAASAEKITFALTSNNTDTTPTVIGQEKTVYNNQSSVVVGDAASDRLVTANFNFANVQTSITTGYLGVDSTQIAQSTSASTVAVTAADGSVTSEANTKAGINIKSYAKANSAITSINNAIETVSTARAKLGAYQNRLEHTITNLGTASENLTAAESRVRDVDYAEAA